MLVSQFQYTSLDVSFSLKTYYGNIFYKNLDSKGPYKLFNSFQSSHLILCQ